MRSGLFSPRGLAIVAVSVISVIGGGLLAWWQWTRFESATGTLQNLGYVLQWPLFGVFPAFMFYRIYRSAQRERAAAGDAGAVPAPSDKPAREQVAAEWAYKQNRDTGVGAPGEPDDEGDRELVAYNNYLARLNAAEERDARRGAQRDAH